MSDFRPDIWRLQAQYDTQGLIEALNNADPGIRKRAAAALRALGAIGAIPTLKTILEREADPETRENIVAALAALEAEKTRTEENIATPDAASVLERMIAQLRSDELDRIIEAVNKLGEMRNKRAVEPLVMLFNNVKMPIKVRLAVAEALLKLESAPVEVALLGALRSSKWRVRRNGAAILGQLKADWAVEPLTAALSDENEVVRRTARAALRYINTSEARTALGETEIAAAAPAAIQTGSPAFTAPAAPDHKKDTQTTPTVGDKTAATAQAASASNVTAAETHRPDAPQPAAVNPQNTAAAADTATETASGPAAAAHPAPTYSDSDAPTRLGRPTQPLVWPKRSQPTDASRVPTKPLDPKRLEEAENRGPQDNQDTGDS